MTTTARPLSGQPRGRTPRVLLAAGLAVAAAVVVAAALGGLVAGSPGGLAALTGGGIAGAGLVSGSAVVNAAIRMAPQAAMVVAMTTYTLQVVLVLVVFLALESSGAMGSTLSTGWLAAGVIVATAAWTLGQLVASAKARIPAYDIELPGASEAPLQDSSHGASQPSSRAREVGAP
jgi:ATP synthase protein I